MGKNVFDASYISAFCMELYLTVRAGLPFDEAVGLLRNEETDPQIKTVLDNLHQHLELGEPIAVAMRAAGGFPVYVVEMAEIGQRTGHLEDVFHSLAEYYRRMDQLRQSLRNAVLYPSVLLVMMLFVVLMLLIKVLPIFREVFAQLGAELSPVASALMQIGNFLGIYGLGILVVLVAMLLIGAVALHNGERRQTAMSWIQNQSEKRVIGKLIASSRMADALVLALSSGMDIDDSLDMAAKLVPSAGMQEKILQCKREMLLESKSFADAALNTGLFSPFYCRMIAVGFHTGNIDAVMQEVARRCAEQVDERIESLLNRVEPTLVIVMSLLVGLILLSVMLPLMSILSAIG